MHPETQRPSEAARPGLQQRMVPNRLPRSMYILLTDETNLLANPAAKFFVYGGLFFPIERLPELDRAIAVVRRDTGYKPGDELKFETNARPDHVTIEQARHAKEGVVQACLGIGAQFIAYVVLHKIARTRTQDELVSWGANTVIGKFNQYLDAQGEDGICAVDRLPINADHRYLSDKFSFGLVLQGGERVLLTRIKLLASTCINASHASSAMDIVLGTFRYCINNPANLDAAKQMMVNVTRLIWHVREGDRILAMERGLIFRPTLEHIVVEEYRKEYEALLAHINSLIADVDF